MPRVSNESIQVGQCCDAGVSSDDEKLKKYTAHQQQQQQQQHTLKFLNFHAKFFNVNNIFFQFLGFFSHVTFVKVGHFLLIFWLNKAMLLRCWYFYEHPYFMHLNYLKVKGDNHIPINGNFYFSYLMYFFISYWFPTDLGPWPTLVYLKF